MAKASTLLSPKPADVVVAPERKTRKKRGNKTRELLLDVAEALFGARGYDNTTLLGVSRRAKVNQALVRYYFGSKQGLFTAIYTRRGHQLSRDRLQLLNDLEARPGHPPTIEELVRAFLAPTVEMRRSGGGRAYMRLQARLTNETSDYAMKMRREVHDEAAHRFITAFQRASPNIDANTMYWRMIFMLGSYFYGMSDSNRLNIMSLGNVDGSNVDELYRQLVSFLVGGLRAPLFTEVKGKERKNSAR